MNCSESVDFRYDSVERACLARGRGASCLCPGVLTERRHVGHSGVSCLPTRVDGHRSHPGRGSRPDGRGGSLSRTIRPGVRTREHRLDSSGRQWIADCKPDLQETTRDRGTGIVTDKGSAGSSGFGELDELVNGKRISRRSLLKGAAAMGAAAAIGPIAAACGSSGSTVGVQLGLRGRHAQQGRRPRGRHRRRLGQGHGRSRHRLVRARHRHPVHHVRGSHHVGLRHAGSRTCWPRPSSPTPTAPSGRSSCADGITWHDGKPLTADDVVFSMDRIVDPKDPKVGAATLSGVKVGGTKKVDNQTVEFHLASPNVLLRRGARRTQLQDRAGRLRPQEARSAAVRSR